MSLLKKFLNAVAPQPTHSEILDEITEIVNKVSKYLEEKGIPDKLILYSHDNEESETNDGDYIALYYYGNYDRSVNPTQMQTTPGFLSRCVEFNSGIELYKLVKKIQPKSSAEKTIINNRFAHCIPLTTPASLLLQMKDFIVKNAEIEGAPTFDSLMQKIDQFNAENKPQPIMHHPSSE